VTLRRAALVASLVLAACTDVGPGRGPGTLTATLRSPNGDEGAAVVLLVGEGVVGVNPLGATEAYSVVSRAATRVVLINQAGGSLSFELEVADLRQPVVGLVQQVAGPTDALRSDVSAYRLEFGR
jgi:hypothetical protein